MSTITDQPSIINPRSGESSRRTGYMYPYASMAATVVSALAGRRSTSQDKIDTFVADFEATAAVSEQHAEFVAATLALVAEAKANESERQAAEREHRNPACRRATEDKRAEEEAIKEAFARCFPLPRVEAPAMGDCCRHGVSYMSDCAECGE